MTHRTLADVEAELELQRKHRETFDKIVNGRLTREEEDLQRERLFGLAQELADLKAKNAPPPEPPLLRSLGLANLTREQAAKKAAELRADPRFFKGPGTPDGNGVRLTPEEHALMVKTHRELLALAAGDTGTDDGSSGAPTTTNPGGTT